MWCLANLTPILWEQDGEGAFFQNACWIIFFCESGDSPVINPFMVPGLVLFMLQLTNRLIASL